MAQWLTIVSWVAVILGLLTALAIAFDVAAHPQHMKIMNVVWPITGLYLPIVGWLLYADMARRKPTRRNPPGRAAVKRRRADGGRTSSSRVGVC